jgi:ATP-dependent Clp protease ATP-binding subunit ClpC
MVDGDSTGADHVVLRFAREEAARLGHSYIGAEHLLLGLLRTQDVEVFDFLHRAGVSPDGVRVKLEAAVPAPEGAVSNAEELPLSSRANKIVSLVEQRIRSPDRLRATCRDFLEAMLLEGRNIAAQVLQWHGLPASTQMSPLQELAQRLDRVGVRLLPYAYPAGLTSG